jgi:hypothetical protein
MEKINPAIRQMLDEIDLFIAQEEKALLERTFPPAIVIRLLSDLTLAFTPEFPVLSLQSADQPRRSQVDP